MAILHTQDQNDFVDYCKKCYDIFFLGKAEPVISNTEFIDILCEHQAMKQELLDAFVKEIDKDSSNEISFDELVVILIEYLGVVDLSLDEVLDSMKDHPGYTG